MVKQQAPQVLANRLDAIARMIEEIECKGDAECKLSPDARRLLTQSCVLLRREVEAAR